MTRDDAYVAGRAGSAAILADGYRAGEQLYQDVIDGAHAKAMAISSNLAALVERDRAYGDADDARAYLYAEAEQRHQDRLAALAQHFGQFYGGQGNPAADHARAFVETLDPEDEFAAMPLPAPMPVAVVEFAGSRHERRIDERGRPVPEQSVAGDASRGTFTGDAAAFNAVKARGVMTPAETSAADAHKASLATETSAAYPTTEGRALRPDAGERRVGATLGGIVVAEPIPAIPAPPAGLLADIAAALERTARTKGTS